MLLDTSFILEISDKPGTNKAIILNYGKVLLCRNKSVFNCYKPYSRGLTAPKNNISFLKVNTYKYCHSILNLNPSLIIGSD